MSGDNQHFIPRLYLKGFRIRENPEGKQAWVFRPGVEPQMDYLDNIAADEHFYSPPDPGSLDDAITRYESKLADHFKILKKAKLGHFSNPALPAEVISHLTIRTESMRTGFSYAAKQMALKLFQAFQNDELVKRFLDLDDDVPGDRFKGMIADLLKQHEAALKGIGLSNQGAERIAFLMMKEQFPKLIERVKPNIAALPAGLYHQAEEIIASAQKKALTQSLAPEQRVEFLKGLIWEIVPTDEPATLPDCVAIALKPDGQLLPLLLADSDTTDAVIMPLDHKRLLVGRRNAEIVFRPFMFNVHAISCSENFFVSSVRSKKLEDWSEFIGVVSKTTMLEMLKGAFQEYAPPALPPKRDPDPPYSIKITFKDAKNEDAIKTVSEKINGVADWAVARFSLDRIDNIVFANDVPAAVAEMERGFDSAVPDMQPRTARSVSFLKDNKVHVNIVMATDIAASLLSDPQSIEWTNALYFVVYMLAEAYCNVEFDKAFPGVMLRPHKSYFNLIRYEPVSTAWTSYIASRFSGAFWIDGVEVRRKLVKDALENFQSACAVIGASFREHKDCGRLLAEVSPYIQVILTHAATVAGLADARGLDILEDKQTTEIFQPMELVDWYAGFVADLRQIWERRGQWGSERNL